MLFGKEWIWKLFHSPACTESDDDIGKTEDYEENCGRLSKINKEALSKMISEKDYESLCQAGGVQGVALAVGSELKQGIHGNSEDISIRRKVFGSNTYLETPIPAKSFLQFVIGAFKDVSIVILLFSTVLSLVWGIKKDGWKDGWYNGLVILVCMIAIITVSAVCNFRHTKLFKKQIIERLDTKVSVIRFGKRKNILVRDIVVGDVVQLRAGEQIPADGLLVPGENSLSTDHQDTSIVIDDGDKPHTVDQWNPFLSFGTKFVEGHSNHIEPYMLVTAVGQNTAWGISRQPNKQVKTSFHAQFTMLDFYKENISLIISFILLVVSIVDSFSKDNYKKQNLTDISSKKTTIKEVMTAGLTFIQEHKVPVRALATTATTFLLAIPEGFSLVVTLLIVYSRKQLMRKVRVRVQKLLSCVTAGYVTTIVTDKTSFLMTNTMEVTEFRLSEDVTDASSLPPKIIEIMCQGIGLNTSSILLSNPTEKALLSWAEKELGMNVVEVKHASTVLHCESSNSRKKGAGVWIRKASEGKAIDVHWKGSSKMILARCSHYYEGHGIRELMSKDKRILLEKVVDDMEANGLQCIAFAHKQLIEGKKGESIMEETFPPKKESRKLYERGLNLLGLVGMEYQCHPKIKSAVEDCRKDGIKLIMISKDSILASKALATRCGILGPYPKLNGLVTESDNFISSLKEEELEVPDDTCVLARSSPSDKFLLVQCLKKKGQVVAVTGVGMSDAPVVEEADLRLAMGIRSIRILKEISDIVIMDDDFSSITTILRQGRSTHDIIQKFVQLNLTTNIAGLSLNFVATITLGEEAPFTTLQMLLVNLIVNCMGPFALAHDLPTKELVLKSAVDRNKPLITNVIWRNILVQALFQIVIVLTLQFKQKATFPPDVNINKSLIFNTFVLCQGFNVFNARKLKEKNVFSGLHQSRLFWAIMGMGLLLQFVATELLGKLFNLERLNWDQWASSIAIASVSWPVGLITKCIPVPEIRLNLSFLGCFTRLKKKLRIIFCRWNQLKQSSQSLPLTSTKDA